MVYPTRSEAVTALADLASAHAVVIADLDEHAGPATVATIEGLTILEVGTGSEGAPLRIRHPDAAEELVRPDQMDAVDALVCARRLAAYRAGEAGVGVGGGGGSCWSTLVDIDDVECFDPITLWRNQTTIGFALRSAPRPTVRRLSWTSRSPPKTVWVHTGSAWAPPDQVSRSCCAPSHWA